MYKTFKKYEDLANNFYKLRYSNIGGIPFTKFDNNKKSSFQKEHFKKCLSKGAFIYFACIIYLTIEKVYQDYS